MNILGKKLLLRAIEPRDLDLLHEWSNDPDTQHIMGDIHFPSSRAFHDAWLASLTNDHLNQRFAIESDELGLIGISSIIKIDWRNRHAWHGIMLGNKDIRGKGYGIDSVMSTMRYAFEELGLQRLDGSMIEYNNASIDFYLKKLGWKIEGKRRNYYFRNNRYWDQIVVGVTRDDYFDLVGETSYWDS